MTQKTFLEKKIKLSILNISNILKTWKIMKKQICKEKESKESIECFTKNKEKKENEWKV